MASLSRVLPDISSESDSDSDDTSSDSDEDRRSEGDSSHDSILQSSHDEDQGATGKKNRKRKTTKGGATKARKRHSKQPKTLKKNPVTLPVTQHPLFGEKICC